MGWLDKIVKGKAAYAYNERMKPYSKKKTYYLCPECGSTLETHCLCPRMDATCKNGHKWHIDYDSKTKQSFVRKGHSDHSILITR